MVHLGRGEHEHAAEAATGVVVSQTRRNAYIGHRDSISLAEAYLFGQRLDDALKAGRSVLGVVRASHARGREGHALRVLGGIHAARGERDQAEATYREALAIAAALGMRPLAAHCHLGFARLYRRTADPEQAQQHLATATRMYGEMDMHFWLEQAETEMATLA